MKYIVYSCAHPQTFVWRNNLYYTIDPSEEPEALTTNGEMNNIQNGVKQLNEKGLSTCVFVSISRSTW